jgi:hypothetical protein
MNCKLGEPPCRTNHHVTLNDRLDKNERFVMFCQEFGHVFCGHPDLVSAPAHEKAGFATAAGRATRLRLSPASLPPGQVWLRGQRRSTLGRSLWSVDLRSDRTIGWPVVIPNPNAARAPSITGSAAASPSRRRRGIRHRNQRWQAAQRRLWKLRPRCGRNLVLSSGPASPHLADLATSPDYDGCQKSATPMNQWRRKRRCRKLGT